MSEGQKHEEKSRQDLIKLSQKIAYLATHTDPDEYVQAANRAELLKIRNKIKEAKEAGVLTPDEATGIYFGEPTSLFQRLREKFKKKR